MMQASTKLPSAAACETLLRAMPAFTALRRTLFQAAPSEARGVLGPLFVVARHEQGIRPTKLAEVVHVDLSVVSRAITQLERLGHVERHRDPADGRAHLVHATDAGRAWLASLTADFAEHLRHQLPGWSDDELTEFAATLARLGTSLERPTAEGPAT